MDFKDHFMSYYSRYPKANVNIDHNFELNISYEDLLKKLKRSYNYRCYDRNLRDISYCWMQTKMQKLDSIAYNEHKSLFPKIKKTFITETDIPLDRRKTFKGIVKDEFNRHKTFDSLYQSNKFHYNVIERRKTINTPSERLPELKF